MEEKELIEQAMRALGKRTSEKKAAAARQNATKATSENRSRAQQARREREKLAKENPPPTITEG